MKIFFRACILITLSLVLTQPGFSNGLETIDTSEYRRYMADMERQIAQAQAADQAERDRQLAQMIWEMGLIPIDPPDFPDIVEPMDPGIFTPPGPPIPLPNDEKDRAIAELKAQIDALQSEHDQLEKESADLDDDYEIADRKEDRDCAGNRKGSPKCEQAKHNKGMIASRLEAIADRQYAINKEIRKLQGQLDDEEFPL